MRGYAQASDNRRTRALALTITGGDPSPPPNRQEDQVVRETKTLDELIESARGIAVPPEGLRAPQRAFVYGNTTIANPDVTREIIARVDADFERIFGSK